MSISMTFLLTITVGFTIQFTISVDTPTYNVSQASFSPIRSLREKAAWERGYLGMCMHYMLIITIIATETGKGMFSDFYA